MPDKSSSSLGQRDNYFRQTLRPQNCLLFILPMLLFFHLGTTLYGSALLVHNLVGKVLWFFGGTASFLPGLLILAVLLLQHFFQHDKWKFRPAVLCGMLGESVMWVVPLIGISYITGRLAAPAAITAASADDVLQSVLVAVGAGVYEEFVFRLVLISLIMLFMVDVFGLPKDTTAVAAVIATGLVFSLCHFSWERLSGSSHMQWDRFSFLAIAGVFWGALYMYRGLGIAVGAHTMWDLYLVFLGMYQSGTGMAG